jgi:alkanesulfonate monooxygenase SsuD/methylene tetrahydromethanopterin reductase-like flavin-dependent oxidoreductase (luciferase family)
MEIGIGLPNTLDIPGPQILDWARRAEERGFSTLATIDRIVYPNYDSLTTLAAAGAVTSRIGLLTNILLAPAYQPVHLAKVSASVDAITGGRLTLGLGVGGRPDDFAALNRPFERRGKLMDEALDLLHRAWAGEPVTGDDFPVGPAPAAGNRVSTIIGGTSDATWDRVAKYAEGWTSGGVPPDQIGPSIEKVRKAWQAAGREGEPRIAALVYYGLGDEDVSRASLRRYYGFLGDWTDMIVEGALRTPEAIKGAISAYAGAGVTELVLNPTVPKLEQVDRLADAVH